MIFRSYLVEENIDILKNNLALFYGQNDGLIEEFKNKISNYYKKFKVLRLTQEEILNNNDLLYDELSNLSLFEEKKILFIQNANDKLFNIINEIQDLIKDSKVYVFSNTLEKKSKLRAFFEKNKQADIIPCYEDTEITLKKIISNNLKNYVELTPTLTNLIIDKCSSNRTKLRNEISKIKSYFNGKHLKNDELARLLNYKEEEDFNLIKDAALIGDKQKINNLLDTSLIEEDKLMFYLAIVNQRLLKLKEVSGANNIEKKIEELKPPIFWKDKSNFIHQAKIWNKKKLNIILKETYNIETKIKSNSSLNKKIVLKKMLIDLCNLANAA